MNELFSDKKTGFLIVVALVFVVIGAIYYFLIYPLNEEKQLKEVAVNNVRTEVAVLQSELASPEVEESEVNTFSLEKKVPLTRELDRLIRSIEKVDLISESKIESISFNNYDEVVAESNLAHTQNDEETVTGNLEGDTSTETEILEDGTLTESEIVTPVSPMANISLPPQLKLITFNITLLTKDYDQLIVFIKELEKLERIVRVDRIEFNMPGEEQNYDIDSKKTAYAEIQVTTFYHDGEK
ncbi:hypothetical protein WAX74_07095 [Psychrobacillus sp. FJAT-51614]|uniref:Potassium transporter n=1 Tax=Psychrobacillus mangrovi TaxID=3117745 RepID=A0ABU8F337_9BACI